MKKLIKIFKLIGKKNTLLFILYFIFAVISSLLGSAVPALGKNFIDNLNKGIYEINIIFLIFSFVFAEHFIGSVLNYKGTELNLLAVRELCLDTVKRVLKLEWRKFNARESVHYSEIAYRNAVRSCFFLDGQRMSSVSAVFKIIFITYFVFRIDILTSFAILAYMALSIPFALYGNKYFYDGYDKNIEEYMNIIEVLSDQMKGITEITTCGVFESEKKIYQEKLKKFEKRVIRFDMIDYFNSFFSTRILSGILIVFAVYRGIQTREPGIVFALAVYSVQIKNAFSSSFFGLWDTLRESVVNIKKVEEL